MARFVSLSGCLNCTQNQVQLIKEIIHDFTTNYDRNLISEEQVQLYLQGWYFPDVRFNWTNYIFFGGDIKQSSLSFFKDLINFIIQEICIKNQTDSNVDLDRLDGHFVIKEEDSDRLLLWVIKDSIIIEQYL